MPARLDLSQDKFVSRDRPRYAVHVKEKFEAIVHVPLYVSPFGVASCSNKTVLEARVWDLPAERFLGSFTVTAEGEFTVVAYMLHMVVSPDTQKDAMERFAREIVVRLTGLKPLENKMISPGARAVPVLHSQPGGSETRSRHALPRATWILGAFAVQSAHGSRGGGA